MARGRSFLSCTCVTTWAYKVTIVKTSKDILLWSSGDNLLQRQYGHGQYFHLKDLRSDKRKL